MKKEYDDILTDIERMNKKSSSISMYFFACFFLLLLIGLYYETHLHARENAWNFIFRSYRILSGENNGLSKDEIDQILSKGPDTKFVLCVKSTIKNILNSWAQILLTYNGILAATLILFYSLKDNKREGIPNRRIMSFAFGSTTAPVLFAMSMVCLPVYYFFWHMQLYFYSLFLIIFITFLQVTIMFIILKSTSHLYHIKQIQKIEKSQLKYILENQDTINSYGIPIWTYFTRYMSEALSSTELLTDQMDLVREILYIPFESIRLSNRHKKHKRCEKMSLSPDNYYDFYYNNLSASLKKITNNQELTRLTFIDTVSDFISRLLSLYLRENHDIDEGTILIIESAIIKAIFETRQDYQKADMESIRIVNQLMTIVDCYEKEMSEANKNATELKRKILIEYVIYQGYLQCKETDTVKIKNLDYLNNISLLKTSQFSNDEKDLCFRIWRLWARESEKEIGYLKKVIDTFDRKTKECLPIVLILSYTEGQKYESSYSAT